MRRAVFFKLLPLLIQYTSKPVLWQVGKLDGIGGIASGSAQVAKIKKILGQKCTIL